MTRAGRVTGMPCEIRDVEVGEEAALVRSHVVVLHAPMAGRR